MSSNMLANNHGKDWDEEAYLWAYPDVAQGVLSGHFKSGQDHFNIYGKSEGRMSGSALRSQYACFQVNDWIRNEMRKQSQFEYELYPSDAFFRSMTVYNPMKPTEAGNVYAAMRKALPHDQYTHILVLPWLKRGGADLASLHHINFLARRPEARVLVITTENSDNPWLYKIPAEVSHLDFGKCASELSRHERLSLFSRIILQLSPSTVHIINSEIGWEMIARHGKAISEVSRIFVSLYCFDYTNEGEPVGYARLLRDCASSISSVFTDNSRFAEDQSAMHGILASKFVVLKHPVKIAPRFMSVTEKSMSVLWASRLDRQKRPDLLAKVASILPEVTFDVYGGALLEGANYKNELASIPNIRLKGEFEGFNSIPTSKYAAFLYTAQWDGLPNIVLEAAASGLPIIASNIGGISELIDSTTGYLVTPYDQAREYAVAIASVINDPVTAKTRAESLLKKLKEQYSQDAYAASLLQVPGYVSSESLNEHKEEENAAIRNAELVEHS